MGQGGAGCTTKSGGWHQFCIVYLADDDLKDVEKDFAERNV